MLCSENDINRKKLDYSIYSQTEACTNKNRNMSHLHSLAIVLLTCLQIVLAVSSSAEVNSQEQAQQNSTSLYDKLCQNHYRSPKSIKFSIGNLEDAKKWHFLFGSDVTRQFLGSLLKGKQLPRNDDKVYKGMCVEVNKPFAQLGKFAIGTHHGLGKLNPSVYNCISNERIPGSMKCLNYNVRTKYQAKVVAHFMDTEKQNYHISVHCYPNKEVGWLAFSSSPFLTNEDYASLKNQIVALGFEGENIVPMYDEKCNNEGIPE